MSAPNGLQTACERFANEMRVCADGTANLRCAIHKRFAYCLLRENKENWMCLHALGVLCSPQVHGKLISRMRTAQRVSGALVYTKLKVLAAVVATEGLSN